MGALFIAIAIAFASIAIGDAMVKQEELRLECPPRESR